MINWDRIEELRSEIGDEDFKEVADMFIEEIDGVVARLMTAPCVDSLEEDLHFMKGSALNLGFAQFSHLCQVAERQASEGDFEAVDLTAILAAYQSNKTEFMAGVPAE